LSRFGRAAFGASVLILSSETAFAQPGPADVTIPRRTTDPRGVDLVDGDMPIRVPLVSFGENSTSLAAWIEVSPQTMGVIPTYGITVQSQIGASVRPEAHSQGFGGSDQDLRGWEAVTFPNSSGFTEAFISWGNEDGSYYYHTNPDGSSYTHSFGTTHFTRFQSPTDPDLNGIFDAAGDRAITPSPFPSATWQYFDSIIYANREEWHFYRQQVTVPCTIFCGMPTVTFYRLRFLTSSRGYGIQFLYVSDATPSSDVTAGNWRAPRQVTGYNKASVYCNESLLAECTVVSALPSAQITYNNSTNTVLIRPPGSATDGTELGYSVYPAPPTIRQTAVPNSTVSFNLAVDNAGRGYISRVTDSDGQWNYTHETLTDDSGHIPYMHATSTNPQGGVVEVFGYGIFGTIQYYLNELGGTYNYSDGFPYRDWGTTEPDWNGTYIDRDERNNITYIWRYPNVSGPPPLTLYHATYPTDCTNPRTCNHPTTVTDGNNNVWTYTYAPEHGGVQTETGPAAPTRQSNGTIANVSPQKRYEYVQRYAWISNGSGGYVHASSPLWLLSRERHCISTAPSGSSCTGGAADEVVTDYDYGPDSGPNNLNQRGVAVTAYLGGSPVTHRTCYGYDANGNRISQTLPNANLGSCP
jgi:hypothetical protein